MECLLGMDAGGTKTLCAVADTQGRILGFGLAGCGNFQISGELAAARELAISIERALQAAGISTEEVATAYYGIAGADRPKDFRIVRDLLEPINRAPKMCLENDTTIALRAGTDDGVGLGLISGTGTNAIGFNARGERIQVGGWGSPYLGDFGSAHDIAAEAIARAQRGRDGRGPPTRLYERLIEALGVKELVDISERNYFDSHRSLDVASLAPLVFDAASDGDSIALEILKKAGREISLAALAVLRALFTQDDEIPVVLGGSVFQKGTHHAMVESLEQQVRREFRRVRFRVLQEDPVAGALLGAADLFFGKNLPPEFRKTLLANMRRMRPGNTRGQAFEQNR